MNEYAADSDVALHSMHSKILLCSCMNPSLPAIPQSSHSAFITCRDDCSAAVEQARSVQAGYDCLAVGRVLLEMLLVPCMRWSSCKRQISSLLTTATAPIALCAYNKTVMDR